MGRAEPIEEPGVTSPEVDRNRQFFHARLYQQQLIELRGIERYSVQAVTRTAPQGATAEDLEIAAYQVRQLIGKIEHPKYLTQGFNITSTYRAIARALESTRPQGRREGAKLRDDLRGDFSEVAAIKLLARDEPPVLDYFARAIWADVVLPNPAGLLGCHADNLIHLGRANVKQGRAVIGSHVVADIDERRLGKGRFSCRPDRGWALLRKLSNTHRKQTLTDCPNPEIVNFGTWQETADAVLGREATRSETEQIRATARSLAACNFAPGYSLSGGKVVRRGGTLFELEGSTFKLAPSVRHYARRQILEKLGPNWQRDARPAQHRALALIPVSGVPVGIVTQNDGWLLEVYTEILCNPWAAVTEGLHLASTNDFASFDLEPIATRKTVPFCTRSTIPYPEINRFCETLARLGLIKRFVRSTDLDSFALFPQIGGWTAADLHSREWLDGYARARCRELDQALRGAKP